MLKTPSEFPNPGSFAMLGSARVRIISHRGQGEALVSLSKLGGSITRTVAIDDLQQPVDDRPIHARKRRGRRTSA